MDSKSLWLNSTISICLIASIELDSRVERVIATLVIEISKNIFAFSIIRRRHNKWDLKILQKKLRTIEDFDKKDWGEYDKKLKEKEFICEDDNASAWELKGQ